jgi:excisionase family DNA binding protein
MISSQSDRLCFSIDNAAELMSVGKRTLYRQIALGHIATVTMGKRRLVPASALRAWLEAASKPAHQKARS